MRALGGRERSRLRHHVRPAVSLDHLEFVARSGERETIRVPGVKIHTFASAAQCEAHRFAVVHIVDGGMQCVLHRSEVRIVAIVPVCVSRSAGAARDALFGAGVSVVCQEALQPSGALGVRVALAGAGPEVRRLIVVAA